MPSNTVMRPETQADERDGDATAGDCRIYVGNLIPKANELHLQKVFARFGVIHNVWVARKVRFAASPQQPMYGLM